MIGISLPSSRSFAGRLLRLPLRLIPATAVLPILQGPLRGKRWIKGSGINRHWYGNYELPKQRLFQQHVKQGDIVYDIGANVGFYTLLASHLVGDRGTVFAFEPLPRNGEYLCKHVALNHKTNVVFLELAVTDFNGLVRFDTGIDNYQGNVSDNGTLFVRSGTLDSLLAAGAIAPAGVIKIDVEGGEYRVLRGAEQLLRSHRPIIFLALHSKALLESCSAFLSGVGYSLSLIEEGPGELSEMLGVFPQSS